MKVVKNVLNNTILPPFILLLVMALVVGLSLACDWVLSTFFGVKIGLPILMLVFTAVILSYLISVQVSEQINARLKKNVFATTLLPPLMIFLMGALVVGLSMVSDWGLSTYLSVHIDLLILVLAFASMMVLHLISVKISAQLDNAQPEKKAS